MLCFRRLRSLQKFESVHASVFNHFNHFNHFNQERCRSGRKDFKADLIAVFAEWRDLRAAWRIAPTENPKRVRTCLTDPKTTMRSYCFDRAR
jgi:hypothetical protein